MQARVIVTSSSDEKLLRVKAMGADAGINYKREPAWSNRVLQLTNDHGADVVVDVGGKNTLDQSVKSLADEGTLSVVGGLSGYDGSIWAWGLLEKSARAQGVFVGSRADYLRMIAFITEHGLHPVIERVYPLDQYADAFAAARFRKLHREDRASPIGQQEFAKERYGVVGRVQIVEGGTYATSVESGGS